MSEHITNRSTALVIGLILLTTLATGVTMAQDGPSHGGSMTNTHNDLYIVQEDAENPQGIERAYGEVFIKETISLSNDDPLKVPDYAVIYVDPTFNPDPNTPIVVSYTHEYNITNYTLQLIHLVDGYVGNFTGFTTTSATLQPGIDLGPEGPEMPHPKVNASYLWRIWSVTEQNRQLVWKSGGEVITEIYNDTVFDWPDLDLPAIGSHTYEANSSALAVMTISSIMEPHPSLSDGWYRFSITDEVFEYGVSLTIELRYTGFMEAGRVVLNKFIFTNRIIHVDIFHKSGDEVIMYSEGEGKGNVIPPTQASSGPGTPTKFTIDTTFSLVIQEEGSDGTDLAQYGRYALLAVLIGVLLFMVLWSGKGKRTSEDGTAGSDDPEKDRRRAELEKQKVSLMAQIKDMDQRHDDGELGTGVYNRKRNTLKARTVDVMRQLAELDGGPSEDQAEDDDGGPEYTGERADLEEEKEEILERIRDLDSRHDDGEVSDDVWKRKRKHLKAEAVEIMQEIAALEDEGE